MVKAAIFVSKLQRVSPEEGPFVPVVKKLSFWLTPISNSTFNNMETTESEKSFAKPHIRHIVYSAQGFSESEPDEIRSIFPLTEKEGEIHWIHLSGVSDREVIVSLVRDLGMNELDAKDILSKRHIMTVEEYDRNIFIILPVSYHLNKKRRFTEQVALIMGKNYLVTIQESNHLLFERIVNTIRTGPYPRQNVRKPGFLLASALDEVITGYGDQIVRLEDALEDLEDKLLDLKRPHAAVISEIQKRRRELIQLRKQLVPFKDQLVKLLRVDPGLITMTEVPYFKDIYDQLLYILQNIDSCREILSSLVDLYLSNNDVKMNIVMKQLTVIATIFIPLTFLVGVWGMNFRFMPELNWKYGYLFAWGVIVAIAGFVWWWLKRKDWL